jgi:hypothetical protein
LPFLKPFAHKTKIKVNQWKNRQTFGCGTEKTQRKSKNKKECIEKESRDLRREQKNRL